MKKLYTEEADAQPYDNLEEGEKPPEVLSKPRVILLNMTSFGINLMVLLLCVEVVPAQVQALVGDVAKGRTLGGMVAGGAALTFMVSPIIGMASDRLQYRMGKRRPVMLVGTIFLCIGLLGMAFSAPEVTIQNMPKPKNPNSTHQCERDLVMERCLPYWNSSVPPHPYREPPKGAGQPASNLIPDDMQDSKAGGDRPGNLGLYIVFFLVVISGQATITVPFNALVADTSHPSQRGFNSGVMGAMILMGNVAGAGIGVSFTHIGVFSIYGCIIGVIVVSVAITSITTRETPSKEGESRPRIGIKEIFCGFWEPLKEHDFRWVFLTRFLMQQGVATVTGFLEYWLDDMVQLPNCWNAATSVALMLIPLLFSAAFSSVVFGVISDRTGRRKIIVIGAAFLMGCAALTNAFIRGDYAYYVAIVMAFLFGIGFGAFQSVDFALVMDVLPDEHDKAKDIAVWHQALVLPQALATPVGGALLDSFERLNCELGLGYIILFLITAFYFLLSGIFVYKIQRAR